MRHHVSKVLREGRLDGAPAWPLRLADAVQIERSELQLGFPDELLPVRSYALR